MRSLIFAALFSAAACTHAPGALGQSVSLAEGIPFKNDVEISINGHGPFRFGLDTGASTAFSINPEIARQLALPVTSQIHLHVPNAADDRSAPAVDVVRIDTLELAGHSFPHVIGIAGAKKGDGTLGISLFNDVLLRIDYPNDRLYVSSGSLPEPDGKHIFAYTEEHTHPVISVVLGGVPMSARLDTGARSTGTDVMVPLSLAAQLRLKAPMQQSGTISDVLGRQHTNYSATLDGDLSIGDIKVHNPTLSISEMVPYLNLGGLCNRLSITLDHRQHRLKLEMQPE